MPEKTYRHEDTNRLASSGQNANDVWRLDFWLSHPPPNRAYSHTFAKMQ
nr:hypothetical protein [Proteus mirabilis]